MRLATPQREIWVTGLGLVAAGHAGGRDAAARLRERLLNSADRPAPGPGEELSVTDFDAAALLGPRGLRHLSRGTLWLMSAALLAAQDAGLDGEARELAGVAAGTVTGSAAMVADFDRTTLREGPLAPNPALFPQTVWNGAASQVAIRHGLRGPNLTVSSGLNSGLDAVLTAARGIACGGARAFLAGGFEELSPYLRVIFAPGSLEHAPLPLCEGAAVLVLEDASAAAARGARALASLPGWGSDCAPSVAAAAARARRVWRHEIPAGSATAPASAVTTAIVERLGCGGGFTGALAALLAAAPGAAAGCARELVTAADGRGRHSALLVERAG